jgi:hypothetical protein
MTMTRRRPRQRILGAWDSRAPQQRKVHGITAAERAYLASIQGGACAICGRTGERLQVDHDHRHCPGREGCRRCIRGLLCGRCNTALGKFGDHHIPQLLAYLSR